MKLFKPFFSDHESYHEINKGRLQTFIQQTLPHSIASVISTLIMLWMFYEDLSEQNRIIWISSIVILISSILLLYGLYAKKRESISFKAWSYITFVSTSIWGIIWSLVPLLFFDEPLSSTVFFVFVVTGSMFVIPAHSMASFLWAYVGFMTPIAVGIIIYILFISPSMPSFMAYMLVYLWITMIAYGYSLHRNIIKLIILKIEHERNSQLKSRFLAIASHDIRQPLQSINLFLSVLKKQKTIKDISNNTYFKHIEESANNMSDLLNDILDTSKIDKQQISFVLSHFLISPVIERVLNRYSKPAQAKNLQIDYTCDKDIVIYADLITFERVLNNLISNAVRYTQQGKININVYLEKNRLHICIKDTGIGMSNQTLLSIFDEFYRDKQAQNLDKAGLGLGLSIVKQLCDMQQWELTVNSVLGVGSQFCINCPAGKIDEIKSQPSATVFSHFDFKNYQAILIDDNESVRISMQAQLQEWGLKTQTFSDPKQAIVYLDSAETKPDLIISDNEINNEKGTESIKKILNLYPDEPFKYLMISGDTSQSLLDFTREQGITLLHKPIKPAQLKNAIRQICQGKILSDNR